MPPNPCRNWRVAMGFRNQQQAAEALGYSLQRVKQWEANPEHNPVPRHVLLAMAAIYHKLRPWD